MRVIGKSSGSNTSTTTSSNSPPAAFTQAYTDTYNTAQSVADTPYEQYTGNLVAGLSPDTSAGITSVENNQGLADPYINSAANYINASTTPLSQYYNPYGQAAMSQYGSANSTNQAAQNYTTAGGNSITAGDISQYESPYTQQVVNATQAEFNNQNQQQATSLAGNAISNGAFGGDREAVAQSTLAGQQQLSQAPTIASLENQGYSQAVSTAEAEQQAKLNAGQGLTSEASQLGQTGAGISNVGSTYLGANEANAWLNSQAGSSMASLGSEAQSSAQSDANALLSVGTTEQNQAQSLLNVPYEQYTAQQSYPFQTTNWLSGIASGLGSNSGGTSSSSNTSNTGNSASSIIGAGLTTAGLANSAFSTSSGSNNGLSNIFSSIFGSGSSGSSDLTSGLGDSWNIQRGGSVPQRATGGGMMPHPLASGGTTGFSTTGSPDQMISIPTGNSDVPDVSLGVVPASQKSSGTPLILGNYGTTSTTSGGGGSSGASSAISDIGTVASIAALAFSDRRLKEDISRVGTLKDGTPVHRYRYKGDPQWHIGLIADEVEHRHPDAVGSRGGYQTVDYKKATEDSLHRAQGGGMRPANDEHFGGWQMPRRASGGSNISVTMVPGTYAGSQSIPMLVNNSQGDANNAGVGSSVTSTPPSDAGSLGQGALSSNPRIQSYLSSQLGSASFTPATTYNPSTSSYGPAGHTTASPASTTSSSSGTSGTDYSSAAYNGLADTAWLSDPNNFSSSSGGSARGGKIRHFDAGGGDAMPPSQIFPDDPTPQVGQSAGMMPDVGSGVDMGQGSGPPEADSPQSSPTIAAASSEPVGGMGAPPSDMGMQPPSGGSQEREPPKKHGKDWGELLTLIGANMMAGRSGSALENIGSGIAQGMKQYENEEAVAARLSNAADDIQRKIKQGDEKNVISDERAKTYQQRVTSLGEFQAGSLAVRQRVADIQQQRANQGDRALDDREATSLAQQQLSQQKLNLQMEAMDNAQTSKGKEFALKANGQQLNAALNWMHQNTSRDPYTGKILKQPSIEESMDAIGGVMPQQQQGAAATRPAATAPLAPPDAAISALRSNPGLAEQFKQKYGVDPRQYLGGQ